MITSPHPVATPMVGSSFHNECWVRVGKLYFLIVEKILSDFFFNFFSEYFKQFLHAQFQKLLPGCSQSFLLEFFQVFLSKFCPGLLPVLFPVNAPEIQSLQRLLFEKHKGFILKCLQRVHLEFFQRLFSEFFL